MIIPMINVIKYAVLSWGDTARRGGRIRCRNQPGFGGFLIGYGNLNKAFIAELTQA